ncbi:MAG TPA: RidA family protein [Stellaceae bacterium]|nr:RidA family protein [Stellaceae bacterium]
MPAWSGRAPNPAAQRGRNIAIAGRSKMTAKTRRAPAQTRQIFENMKRILDTASASFHDVLRVTVYLTDVNDREAINPVRQEYFGAVRLASTLIEVSALAISGMKVEIEAVFGLPARVGIRVAALDRFVASRLAMTAWELP